MRISIRTLLFASGAVAFMLALSFMLGSPATAALMVGSLAFLLAAGRLSAQLTGVLFRKIAFNVNELILPAFLLIGMIGSSHIVNQRTNQAQAIAENAHTSLTSHFSRSESCPLDINELTFKGENSLLVRSEAIRYFRYDDFRCGIAFEVALMVSCRKGIDDNEWFCDD